MIRDVKMGKNVSIECPNSVIIKNCELGDNVYIGANVKIIDVKIGRDTKIYSFVNLYGPNLIIGENCKIGCFVEIQKDVIIGNKSIISSHSFICSGVTLEGNNFISHGCMFSNDRFPQAYNEKYYLEKTTIKYGAVIGSGSNLLPVTVGRFATIGMGSIIVEDVPDYGLVYGKNSKALLVKIKPNKLTRD